LKKKKCPKTTPQVVGGTSKNELGLEGVVANKKRGRKKKKEGGGQINCQGCGIKSLGLGKKQGGKKVCTKS